MLISIDGGALCVKSENHYGAFRFTKELLKALKVYDSVNKYRVYTYCDIDNEHKQVGQIYKHVRPHKGWMKLQISREEILSRNKIFLAINQALPLYTPARKIAISHGLSYYHHPNYYKKEYTKLMNMLRSYTQLADEIIVSSTRLQDDLLMLPFSVRGKIHIVLFGIPFNYQTYEKTKASTILTL